MFRNVSMCIAGVLTCCIISAGEPPAVPATPPKPYRPFGDLPQVLYFEDFEGASHIMKEGKIATVDTLPPGANTVWDPHRPDWGKNDKVCLSHWIPTDARAQFPAGTPPAQIGIHVSVWAEDDGDVILKAFHKDGDYEDKIRVPAKKWTPVNMKFSDFSVKRDNRVLRAEPEHTCTRLEVIFRPRDKDKYKQFYIDDVLITSGVPRAGDILPRVQAVRKSIIQLTRTREKDGFNFSGITQDTLKAAVKAAPARRRNKTVLVAAAKPEQSAELVKALTAASSKLRFTGTFTTVVGTDGGAVGGIDDTRLFVPYNIDKTDPEYAVVMLSLADARLPGRPAESMRVTLQRLLERGALPVVILPMAVPGMADKDKKDLEGFLNTVNNVCIQVGCPAVDPGFAIKDPATAITDGELNATAIAAVSGIVGTALKHMDTHVFGRK